MTSVLCHLRAMDAARLRLRGDVDSRLVALYRAGVRDVRVVGSPAPGNHGGVAVSLRAPDGSALSVEAATVAVALDRVERAILPGLRSEGETA